LSKFFLTRGADGQQPEKVYLLGWLTLNTVSGGPEEGFLRAIRENGYILGENLVIEVRDAMGQSDRYASLAAELVALIRPDCILAMGVGPTRAAKDATTTIPIVMATPMMIPSDKV
jgi:putative ABC transport system substrate-binding protein